MADAYNRGVREKLNERFIQHAFTWFVDSRGRLVHENPCRSLEEDTTEGQPLLLPEGQHLCPRAAGVEETGKSWQSRKIEYGL